MVNELTVKLVDYTPLDVLIKSIRICYDSENAKKKTEDKILIRNLIAKNHTSPLEHIKYTFYILGLSRAALMELSRHRIASMSVMSTRYTLNKTEWDILSTGSQKLDVVVAEYVNKLKKLQKELNLPNDILKKAMPECLATKLVWSINARSLRNFFTQRFQPTALIDMQQLSLLVYEEIKNNIPEHLILFEEWDLAKKVGFCEED